MKVFNAITSFCIAFLAAGIFILGEGVGFVGDVLREGAVRLDSSIDPDDPNNSPFDPDDFWY